MKNEDYKLVQSLLGQGAFDGPDYGKRMLELAVENRGTGTLWMLLERSLQGGRHVIAYRSLMPFEEEGTVQVFLRLLRRGEDANAKDMSKIELTMAAEREFWCSFYGTLLDSAAVNMRVNGETLLLLVLEEYRWIRKNVGGGYYDLETKHSRLDQETKNSRFDHVGILGILTIIAHLLIPRMGKTINEANKDGKTALHLAAEGGLWEIVSALVRYNANTTRTESERLYPRDLVRDEDKQEYDGWIQWGLDGREWDKAKSAQRAVSSFVQPRTGCIYTSGVF